MNPYYRVACVGYSKIETQQFTTRSAQLRRLLRFVPVPGVVELHAMAPRRRFDAVLIGSSDYAACPAGSLSLRSEHDTVLPIFVNGVRSFRPVNKEVGGTPIYISFTETPVESAAFRLCTEGMNRDRQATTTLNFNLPEQNSQEGLMRDILDGSTDSIIVTDASGIVCYANSATADLFDQPPDELVGKRVEFLTQDTAAKEYVLQRDNGDCRTVEITTRLGTLSEFQTFIHSIRDVTERNALQTAELEGESSRGQEEKWRSLESLSAGISHQFNNILMIILGHCSRLKAKSGLDLSLNESVLQIEKSAMRAADITNHLLTFAGQVKYTFENVSVSEMIERLHYLLDAISFRRAVIEYNLEADVPLVNGDLPQLQRLLFDVVNNALESIQGERGVISVTTGWMDFDPIQNMSVRLTDDLPAGRYAYIQISDTGAGMDEATVQKMFQPFYSTKSSRTGLGLSAALGIVRAHSGAMGVHSMPGRGTTVEIFLPTAEVFTMEENLYMDNGGSQLPILQPLRVLIAEDEGDLRDVLGDYLSSSGCEVTTSEDGKDCIEKYHAGKGAFDCVVLDMSMPNMDGEETFNALRDLGSDAPVIVTSGFTEGATISRLKAAGAYFLQKPYQLHLLDELMKRAVVANSVRTPRLDLHT